MVRADSRRSGRVASRFLTAARAVMIGLRREMEASDYCAVRRIRCAARHRTGELQAAPASEPLQAFNKRCDAPAG
jgi:hypothetical protein